MLEFLVKRPSAVAAALLATTWLASAQAQTAGTRVPVGLNPKAIAVNPVTNKVYVANADADTVTVIDGNSGATNTIAVGEYPSWIGINAETNRIYVSTLFGANTAIIDGNTDTVATTTASGGGGWTAINPVNDTAYVVRYGGADEVNIIEGLNYLLTFATRSFEPVYIAVNPTNNRVFVANKATTDIVAMDLTTPVFYPPLLCPDGSGGFRPQPPDPPVGEPDPYGLPCIDIPGIPVAVALNPVTGKIYSLSDGASEQIHVISGTNHTYVSLSPPGTLGTARTIAVNPVTNKVYAVFARAVVVVDGATNAMTVIPAGSETGDATSIGINVLTNMAYVAVSDGTLLVINGETGATSTVSITVGANAVAINPSTNMVYVLDAGGGVTPVTGAAGTATATGITTTISPLPGDTGGTSGSITLNAASTMTPAPLDSVRRVYYRIGTTGPWSEASGSGPFTAGYSGLAPGSHTIYAYATNGLEAPNANTDLASVPVVGNVASYTFTVAATTQYELAVARAGGFGNVTSAPAGISCGSDCTESYTSGTEVTLTATPLAGSTFLGWTGACAGTATCTLTMDAAKSVTATFGASGPGVAVLPTDLNGDGRSDILWRNTSTGQVFRMLMNGFAVSSASMAYAEPNTAWKIVGDADFNGDGRGDVLWRNDSTGQVYLMTFGATGMPTGGAVVYTEANPAWKIVHTPDLNGDGRADILWWNSSTGQVYAVLLNGTSGVIGQGFVYTEPNTNWKIAAVGDLAGSGKQNQLVWRNGTSGQVFLMTVTFSGGVFTQTGAMIYAEPNTAWRIVGLPDLNGDGKSDLLWRNGTTGQVYGMLMNGGAIGAQGMIYVDANTAWKIVAFGDYDGDGRSDLLWRNDTSGQVFMMRMNGLAIGMQAMVYAEPNTSWKVLGPWEYGQSSGMLALSAPADEAKSARGTSTLAGSPLNAGRIGGEPLNEARGLRGKAFNDGVRIGR